MTMSLLTLSLKATPGTTVLFARSSAVTVNESLDELNCQETKLPVVKLNGSPPLSVKTPVAVPTHCVLGSTVVEHVPAQL